MNDPRLRATDQRLLRHATDYLTAMAFNRSPVISFGSGDEWFMACTDAASIHGLGPYLGQRVLDGELSPSEPMAGWLIGQVARNHERLSRMRSELLATLEMLSERGFVAMPVKGAAMLLESVDAVAWRPFADLDLLVQGTKERTQELDLALAHVGYCLGHINWKHRSYTACAPGPALIVGDGEHPDNPRDLDVHAAIIEMFRGFRWDLTPYLLRETRSIARWQVPSPAAMALHLAAHASISALEGTAKAINLIDLDRALGPVGARTFFEIVRDAGLSRFARFVYPAIALVARETGSAASSELEELLRSHVPPGMVDWLTSVSLFHISWGGRDDRATLDRHAIWARSNAERARMLAHTVIPAPSVLSSGAEDMDSLLDLPRAYWSHYRRLAGRVRSATRQR